MKDGIDPIGSARTVATEVAEVVIPGGQEFTLVVYTPHWPLSSDPCFHEVTFELGGCEKRPSTALFEGDRVTLSCFEALDLQAVETLTGRPVLVFPDALYTTRRGPALTRRVAT